MPFLSIILTVYNKEHFLEKCLRSCILQQGVKNTDYEILVVNDGSTDNSLKIIESFQSQYPNVHILNQRNQGLSQARNNGVKGAQGNYVWFVDGDDTITDYSVVRLLQVMKEYCPDVIPIYAKTDGIDKVRNSIPRTLKSGKDVLCCGVWESCAPFYVYKKEFLMQKNLAFYPGIYHEDNEFTPRMLFFAKTVQVVDSILYVVYRDPDSITQVPRVKRAYDYITVAERLYQFFYIENHLSDIKLFPVINRNLAIIVNNALGIIMYFGKEEKQQFNKYLYQKRVVFKSFKNVPAKYSLEKGLFILFPKYYTHIYRVLTMFQHS